MTRAEEDEVERIAKRLVVEMPGTPHVPVAPGGKEDWTGVKASKQWRFCQVLAEEVVRSSGRTFVDPD